MKRLEEGLAERRSSRTESRLDASEMVLIELTSDGRVARVNEQACSLLGLTETEIVGRNWFETCVPAASRERLIASFMRVIVGEAEPGDFSEVPVKAKGGAECVISIRTTPMRDDRGGIVGTLCTGKEVTTLRRPEEALHRPLRELQDYKYAIDESSIVAITDANGKITYVNDTFCRISKYSPWELLGRDHRIINSGFHSQEFFQDLWTTVKSGGVWRGDIRNRAKDGIFYWVSTTIVPFLDDRGSPYQYMAIRQDITQRKLAEAALERTVRDLAVSSERERQRAEALTDARDSLEQANRRITQEHSKLIQAEKLSSIGLLASGVAHEINNPLSGVMACLKALEQGSFPKERRGEYYRTARDGLKRIQQTVRGLLEYARQNPPAATELDAAEVIADCLRLINPVLHKKNVSLQNEIELGTLIVLADRSQMMQGVINLLLNAVQASGKGDTVTLSAVEQDGLAGLRVTDRGAGMSRDIIKKACDPFFTTKPEGEGTGLGLAVTLSIAQANGGDLDFESVEGKGTSATLWLPIRGRGKQ